jgi:hypothetical protein
MSMQREEAADTAAHSGDHSGHRGRAQHVAQRRLGHLVRPDAEVADDVITACAAPAS